MNKDPRFATNPAYVFAAVAYVEKKQIEARRGISFKRGKPSKTSDGNTTYTLDDPYSVLDNVKNTPRYWKKTRSELLARIENFGPFTFFFTLSCGDMRWPENFTALLRDKTITYETINFKEEIFVGKKLLKNYLKENEDKHEFIKKNLLRGYLNITPISLFSVHGRHGAEGREMLASKKLYNSPVLKHNRHGLALVPTTSFCTLP